jgi:MarR family transcriptional regulator, organic hydroperoxide resistance regulator
MPVATTTDFGAAWEAFFRATRRLRARAMTLEGDLSLAQYLLLEPLRTAGELTVGELADSAGVTPPTATRMLDYLAREELILRRHSERDRRSVFVTLTPAGRAAVDAAHAEAIAFRRRVFEELEPEERERATKLLSRLAEVLDEQMT